MNQPRESTLAMAARHVAECEERVARQVAVVEKLDRLGCEREAETARIVLETLQTSLTIGRDHLRLEQENGRS